MADVTSTLNSWSSTAASNLPANSAAVGPNTLADNQRTIQAVVRAALAGDGTIASATITDLSTVNDGDITVTGTTTITGFGTLTAGIKKVLTFSGALTLTHNATSLILPGAANITTAAGDVAIMRSLGSGNWRCIFYQRAAAAAQFDNSTALATTAFVQRALGSLSGIVTLTASGTLTNASVGAMTFFNATGLTATLPLSTGLPSGSIIRIGGNGVVGGGTVSRTGADIIYNGTAPVTSMACAANDYLEYVCVPGQGWYCVGGSGSLANSSAFASSLAESGYQKLPGGLIIQWGVTPTLSTTAVTVTFPIAFPTACGAVALTNSTSSNITVGSMSLTTSSFRGWASAGGSAHNYIAIGH